MNCGLALPDRRWGGDGGTQAVSRRKLMQIGSIAGLGLNLASFFRAETACGAVEPRRTAGSPLRSCILIFCNGGPSHLDTFDMKPDAPTEVRGEFRPIATSEPGCHVCEHLPMTARLMHRVAVIRSMSHRMRGHRSGVTQTLCGMPPPMGDVCTIPEEPVQLPSFGSRLTYLLPDHQQNLPHVALPYTIRDSGVVLPGQSAGFLGAGYQRFQVEADPNAPDFDLTSLNLPADVSLARLEHRESLLGFVDEQLEQSARREAREKMENCYRKAFRLLASDVVRRSFDLTRETPQSRDRYGRNIVGQSVLLARRLVESGVRLVNVNIGDQSNNWYWDDHRNNFGGHKQKLPPFDQAFSALIDDLDNRGLLESTLVISLGEFGRTPKINADAGRDHWPDCYSAVLAGGGIHGGRIHGASDRLGAYPISDSVSPGDFAATLFSRFGLDPATEIYDVAGRPYRLAEGAPVEGLFSAGG